MLSHKKLQQRSKHHYSQDQTLTSSSSTEDDPPGISSSRSVSPDMSDSSQDPETPADVLQRIQFLDNVTTDSEQPQHVHFRSRVRISSGFSRRRRQHLLSRQDAFISISSDSSLSGSPSSSISAPLRSCSDDEANKPGWGPLGQRVSLLAHKSRQQRRRSLPRQGHDARVIPNDRTPLRPSSPLTAYVEGEDAYAETNQSDRERRREIDAAFGTWPRRLVNIHVRLPTYNPRILLTFVDQVVVVATGTCDLLSISG
jgi:hypothetical protein